MVDLLTVETCEKLQDFPSDQVLQFVEQHTEVLKKGALRNLGSEDVVVLCLVRNGEAYIKDFISYYFELGVKQIIILDNGSSDETISIARDSENVFIYQSLLPFKTFRRALKKYLVELFGKNTWSLVVDIDEHLDFPFSEYLTLNEFINYLNQNNYTAVSTQMLDMFPEKELTKEGVYDIGKLQEQYPFYELHSIEKKRYGNLLNDNVINNPFIKEHYGGIRKEKFGIQHILISKHALLYDGNYNSLRTEHAVNNSNIADVSCVLFHYKFHGNFYAYVKDAVEKEYHFKNSIEYKAYYSKFEEEKERFIIHGRNSVKYDRTFSLITQEFLLVTRKYLNWMINTVQKKELKDSELRNNAIRKNKHLISERFKQDCESARIAIDSVAQIDSQLIQKEIIDKLIEENKALNNKLTSIKKSFSWRVTHVFRAFLKLFLKK